ncbi:hypothetical protein VI03_18120 [Burkholderia vietnamiensis]|nr:hypothetical protein VI03_18120 [Burkholderia vietnamiensis]
MFPELCMFMHVELWITSCLHRTYNLLRQVFGTLCLFDNRILRIDPFGEFRVGFDKLNYLIGLPLSVGSFCYKKNTISKTRVIKFFLG